MKEQWAKYLGYLKADFPNVFRAKFTHFCMGLNNWGWVAACPDVAAWGGGDSCPCLPVPCLGLTQPLCVVGAEVGKAGKEPRSIGFALKGESMCKAFLHSHSNYLQLFLLICVKAGSCSL